MKKCFRGLPDRHGGFPVLLLLDEPFHGLGEALAERGKLLGACECLQLERVRKAVCLDSERGKLGTGYGAVSLRIGLVAEIPPDDLPLPRRGVCRRIDSPSLIRPLQHQGARLADGNE